MLRAKRGRGDIGSRMDESGPYSLRASSRQNDNMGDGVRTKEDWESRILGPEKPSFLRRHSSLDSDYDTDSSEHDAARSWKSHSKSRSKEDNSRKRKGKRSKHHKKNPR